MIKYIGLLFLLSSARGQGDIDQLLLQQIFGDPKNPAVPVTAPTPAPIPSQPPSDGVERGQGDITNNFAQPTPSPSTEVDDTTDEEIEQCKTPDGVDGVCVPYYLCNTDNNTVITDGSGVIDIRIRDGPCTSYLATCCLTPNTRPSTNPITPAPPVEERKGCGWRNPAGLGFRITGAKDNEAEFGEFPWMVAILTIEPVDETRDSPKLNVYLGGGSLITRGAVLTAAHLIKPVWKQKTLRVRAGEWDTQTKKEAYPYQDRDVSDVEIHKDFNSGNLFYDVAVIFLMKPVDLAPNVGLACLPPPRQRVLDGTRCLASGWGKDQFEKEGRYQVILKKIEVPVVERNRCQSQLRKTRLGPLFELHTSFMCAGGEAGKDTCKGDGGSPLVCPIEGEPDRYMQSGIVAWGIGCGQDGTPGVYVDVSNLRNWIDNAVAGRGQEISDYVAL